LLIEKQERAQRLVLSGGSDISIPRQVGQECGHLRFRHLARVPFAMETDEADDPIGITAFGANTVVFQTHQIAYLLKEFFWLAWEGRVVQAREHEPWYRGRQPLKQADYTDFICLKLQIFGAEFSLGLCTLLPTHQ
jgi:hypothetical protein